MPIYLSRRAISSVRALSCLAHDLVTPPLDHQNPSLCIDSVEVRTGIHMPIYSVW